jgi:hypothetical protein
MPPDIRANLKKLMTQTLADAANWRYLAFRPESVPATWEKEQHVIADCSKGCQFLARWAGAPDPMDPQHNTFADWGNSQTIWSHLQHADHAHDLEVGDIVTFGRNGDKHAAMVLEPGRDPLLWSHGHQGAPNSYRLSQDHRPAQFCRMPIPAYVPTPQDKLRAKTGWFAWVGWRLGEGDWRPYGRTNATVRPDVPKLIPPRWWADLAVFLANRK